MSMTGAAHPLLRRRDGHHASVTFEELFFDLVYVFAVTQLSHLLLHHLTPMGALETLVLWFAVWLGWQYTCWVTNWFDPRTPPIRGLLFATMLLGLVMAASLPRAFADRGLAFAGAYAAMQVGRTLFVVLQIPGEHPLAANYRRMLGWICLAAVFWITGGLVDHGWRLALWALAVACEYISPMFGFALPGLGRSHTRDWTIEGGHLAERCQLFVIVALGESLLVSGTGFGDSGGWRAANLLALVTTFLGVLALWWLYFGTSSRDATAAIIRSADPGRMGACFHYIHAVLLAGIIVTAVGAGLVLAHPDGTASRAQLVALATGPVIYLLGSAIYKRVVYGTTPLSHVVGSLVLVTALTLLRTRSLLACGAVATATVLGVGLWEALACRRVQARAT